MAAASIGAAKSVRLLASAIFSLVFIGLSYSTPPNDHPVHIASFFEVDQRLHVEQCSFSFAAPVCSGCRCFPLPAPAEQTHCAEASRKERQGGRKWSC